MKPGILPALLVLSAVSAVPLAGEAFSQADTPQGIESLLLESAETKTANTVELSFSEEVGGVGPGDFTVDGLAVTTVSDSKGRTVTLTLADTDVFDSDATPQVTFVGNGVFTTDPDNDRIQTRGSIRAADGLAPTMTGARVTGPDQVTVHYSESVTGRLSDYTNLRVGNPMVGGVPDRSDRDPTDDEYDSRNIVDVHGSGTSLHTLTFIGDPAATNALAIIDIGTVSDTSPNQNRFAGADDVRMADAQAPRADSVKVTGPNEVTVLWSETVTTKGGDYVNLRINGSRNVTQLNGKDVVTGGSPLILDESQVRLTFSGGGVGPSATGVMTIGPVADTGTENTSGRQSNIVVNDGQPPSLVPGGLKVTGPNQITMTVNEAVDGQRVTGDTFSGLRVAGEDRDITDVGVTGAAVTITFGGDGVAPDATAVMTVVNALDGDGTPDDDALVDLAGNLLSDIGPGINAAGELDVVDGQAPALESIAIVSGSTIEAVFSEAVNTDPGGSDFSRFRISGEVRERAISGATGAGTGDDPVTITFAPADLDGDGSADDVAPVTASGTMRVSGSITDAAGNSLAGAGSVQVAAGQAPYITSIRITAPDTITAVFSEEVIVTGTGDFQGLILRGEAVPRGIEGATGAGTEDDPVIITFDDGEEAGGDAPTDATATITVNDSITDLIGTPFIAEQNRPVADGQRPTVGVSVTGPNTVTAVFSEAVNAERGQFTGLRIEDDGQMTAREITGFEALSGAEYAMTFGGAPVRGNAIGNIDVGRGIVDAAGNPFEGPVHPSTMQTDGIAGENDLTVTDGQAPTLESAGITGPNAITIKFSEPVRADRNGFVAFQVLHDGASVNDYRNIAVRVPVQSGSFADLVPAERVELNFSGSAAPLEAAGRINITGEVRDAAGNAFAATGDVQVDAGQVPSVVSAYITAPDTVEITFSEELKSAQEDNFTGLRIDGEAGPRAVTGLALDSDTVTITFDTSGPDGVAGSADDAPAPSGATATIDIAGVTDMQDVPIRAVTGHAVGDRQKPTLAISVTDPSTITAVFSEAVNAERGQFTGLRIEDDGQMTAREITGFEALSGAEYAMTFGGAPVRGNAIGNIDVGRGIVDAAGNPFEGPVHPSTMQTDGIAGENDLTVTDGQAPRLLRAEFLSGSVIGFAYSEPVLSQSTAYTGLLLSTGPDDYRNVIHSGTGTSLILVNYSGPPAADGTGAAVSIDGSIRDGPFDPAGLHMGPTRAEVFPRSAPELVSAHITGPNQVTAIFSEPVTEHNNLKGFPFTDLVIAGEDVPRKITGVAGYDTDTITATFSGDAADVGATGTMDVNGDRADTQEAEHGITDLVGNSLVTVVGVRVGAGQAPSLESAMVTGPNTITLTFSEDVVFADGVLISELFGGLMLYPGGSRNIEDVSIGGSTVTISFDGSGVDTDATASMDVGPGLTDADGNAFAGAAGLDIRAGQQPALLSVSIASGATDPASAAAGDTVAVTFAASEPIARPDVTIHGAPADRITNPADNTWVASRTLQAGDVDGTVTFAIDFESLAGTAGTRVSSTTDGSSVAFNVAPALGTASVTGPNQVTITFSKAVDAGASDFTGLVLRPGGARTVTSVSGSGSDTIAVTFGGAPSATGATASLTLGGGIADLAGIPLAGPLSAEASDGQAPVLTGVSIASDGEDSGIAAVGDTVTLAFTASEPLDSVDVTMDGAGAGASTDDSVTWTAARTVAATDLAGADVAFAIDYADTASNAGAQVTSTTDGSTVTIAQTAANTAAVIGTVFSDTDGNGIRDAGEQGYPGYTMYAIDLADPGAVLEAVTGDDGTYAFEGVRASATTLVQTGFFPAGHTVRDAESSWFSYVFPASGRAATFDVGFYPVPADELTTLNLTVFLDGNRNGMMDAGEGGVEGISFTVYTYTIGPETVTTGADGTVTKADLVPADWAMTGLPEDYLVTVYDYQRSDGTAGKQYDPTLLLADEPEPGSVHTMTVGLAGVRSAHTR